MPITAAVEGVRASVYEVPTDRPEADGTLAWDHTTVVVVEVDAGGETGLGWTYAGSGASSVVDGVLAPAVLGGEAIDVPRHHDSMARAVRNLGRPGIAASAISAVDTALWDLRARLLGLSLADALGRCRDDVAAYGSGGFTTYDDATTEAQLREWVEGWGIPRVKIKIGESWGSDPERDLHRVALARRVVGDDVELFVDANGAYTRKQAIRLGRRMCEDFGVTWFEEPVSSDDIPGLRQVRAACGADVAAGEYGYSLGYFKEMVTAVDCVQVDVTRVGGPTAWLAVAHLAAANGMDVSGHCAPALHAHVGAAVPNCRHVEQFHDHERIERLLFTGAPDPTAGRLRADPARPGHGMSLAPGADGYRRS